MISVFYCWLINTALQIHGILNTLIRLEGNIKMDFKEKLWKGGFDSSCSGQRQVASCCKYCNESLVYNECGDFVD